MLKRCLDVLLSLFLIFLFSPFLILTSILIFFKIGRPILFIQPRTGLKGKPFLIYKFRSMSFCKDSQGNLLKDNARLHSFGKFLRSTSLDELPTFLNVLKGDMSLVGPRPLLIDYLPLYSKKQARRHEVRPGITGWAQINGRNAITWRQKFNMDVWYVDNQSILLDLKILILTIKKVLLRSDISAKNRVTMDRFYGSN
jgi:lipopolysaccharide/colanic/teichoic acid biosynthesis glycosyltransferase